MLDGLNHIDVIGSRFPDLVPGLLEALQEAGLIVDASRSRTYARRDRVRWSVDHRLIGNSEVPTLEGLCVALLTCDATGSLLVPLLAKAGISVLLLADTDPVSSVDIECGVMFTQDMKSDTRASAVASVYGPVVSAQLELVDFPDAAEGADVMILRLPFHGRGIVPVRVREALERGTKVIGYWQDGLDAFVTPILSPEGGPCYNCLMERSLGHLLHMDERLDYYSHRERSGSQGHIYFTGQGALLAGVISMLMLHAEPSSSLRRSAFVVDFGNMTVESERILPLPECRMCFKSRLESGRHER